MPIKKIMQFKERHAPKGSFKANVLTFMTGTVIAQMITVVISPILTRLFAPEAFGIYGVYMSIASIVAAVITLRYDQALMLPKENKDAAHLFWAALFSVAGISVLSLIICILFLEKILLALKVPELGGWILFLPFSIFLWGAYSTLNSWATRQKQFKQASFSQVARSTTVSAVQVSSGLIKAGPPGLIGGAVLGDFFASLVLALQVKHNDGKVLKEGFHWDSIKRLGKQYSDFPLYSSTQNLLNAVSQNIPVLLLAKFFGAEVVGFYALGVRVIQLPMNLILTSLRQVLFQKASEVHNAGGDTYAIFKKTTLGLIAIVIVPALAVILFGPAIFSFVLGKEWVVAGEYARWLVLWMSVGFSNLPATLLAQVFRRQRALLCWDVVTLLVRIAAVVSGGVFLDALSTVILFSIVGVLVNTGLILWMMRFLKEKSVSG